MEYNAVGIDVSKGKSTICIGRPMGEVVAFPFEIKHTKADVDNLIRRINGLDGDTKIVMESTGRYPLPLLTRLSDTGLYLETEAFLREIDYPVDKFFLDDKSARYYMSADLVEAFDSGEEVLCISYVAHIEGTEYRTLATAEIDGEEIEIHVELYKKSDNEWLIYSGDDDWERGPGEDFFK